jgi:hypothetical protein
MSAANIQKFFDKVGQGGELRTKAEAAAGVPLPQLVTMELSQADAPLRKLSDFATKEGYPFTRDELVTTFQKQMADLKKRAASGELTDADLATVAGGGPAGMIVGGIAGALIGGIVAGPAGVGGGATLGSIVGGAGQDLAVLKWGNW